MVISLEKAKIYVGICWAFIGLFCVSFGVVRVVSIFGSKMTKTTSDFSHLTDIFSGHYG